MPRAALLPAGERRFVVVDQYERTLRPALLDEYVNSGYCWVVIGSLQAGRSFAQPEVAPAAIAYYAQLANRARLVYHVSPFPGNRHAVPFSFDWSIDYYPRQYGLPGPEISVYRLTSGKCSPQYAQPEAPMTTIHADTDRRHLARAIELAEQGGDRSAPIRSSEPCSPTSTG